MSQPTNPAQQVPSLDPNSVESFTGSHAIVLSGMEDISDVEQEPDMNLDQNELAALNPASDDTQGAQPIIDKTKIIPLGPSQKILKKLPENLLFQEPNSKELYPDHLAAIYTDYRGQDIPDNEQFTGSFTVSNVVTNDNQNLDAIQTQTDKIVNARLTGSRLVKVTCSLGDRNRTFGSFVPKIGGRLVDEPIIHIEYLMSSQLPGFKLIVGNRGVSADGKKKKDATVYIMANNIARSVNENGSKVAHLRTIQADVMHEAWAQNVLSDAGLQPNDKTGYVGFFCGLISPHNAPPTWGATPDVPYMTNITEQEIAEIRQDWNNELSDPHVSPGDGFLATLLHSDSILVLRELPHSHSMQEAWVFFCQYWLEAMKDAVIMGNFPYYRRLAALHGRDVNDLTLCFDDVPPPRFLVKRWRVTFNEGLAVAADPELWTFLDLETSAHTDHESVALATRIAIDRTHLFEQVSLRSMFADASQPMSVHIERRVGLPCLYMSFNKAQGDKAAGRLHTDSTVKPPVTGTLMKVTVISGDAKGVVLSAAVCEDVLRDGHVLHAVALDPNSTKLPDSDEDYEVAVELLSDGTSYYRQVAAIHSLGLQMTRTQGVDIQRWVLRCAATTMNTDSLAREFAASKSAKEAVANAVSQFKLSAEQLEALELSFKLAIGIAIIWGPAGTGKTYTISATILAHILAGHVEDIRKRQILVTGPTNTAVATLVRNFIANGDPKKNRVEICHFNGGSRRRTDAASSTRDHDSYMRSELYMADTCLWDYISSLTDDATKSIDDLASYNFHRRRKALIDECFRMPRHPLYKDAQAHRLARKQIAKGQTPDIISQGREAKKVLDAKFTAEYLKTVDVVFCTNSTSAHELLTTANAFKPLIAISDEAALASLPDQATPLSIFKESLEMVLLYGDRHQQGPVTLSRGHNEAIRLVNQTLFSSLYHDPRVPLVMLSTQHRMKPWISRPVSSIFYADKLRDHESVRVSHPITKTLLAANAKLRPFLGPTGYKRTLRIAVDIYGRNAVEAEDAQGSKSNLAEAQAIVDYCWYLVNRTPPADGCWIQEADIMILTPYGAQRTQILSLLLGGKYKYGNGTHFGTRIRIRTSAMVQGEEAEIVLLSLVRNKPGNPNALGFIKEAKQLCVNLSRAKECLVIFGNFLTWSRQQVGRLGSKSGNGKRLQTFDAFVADICGNRDIVSGYHFEDMMFGRTLRGADDIRRYLAPSR